MATPGPHASSKVRPIPSLRWWIGGLLFASTVINYIDRQTPSLLAPYLKLEYRWTHTDYATRYCDSGCGSSQGCPPLANHRTSCAPTCWLTLPAARNPTS